MSKYKDTIFALATPPGYSGVAIIRISGENALPIIQKLTGRQEFKARYAYFEKIKSDKEILDEALVLYFKAPYSFTGEDVVEIQCHGSRAVIKDIMEILSNEKARLAEAGEFTRRAVYNNKLDLTQAEGLLDLIHADTTEQRKNAIRQMGGVLQELYNSWRNVLMKNLAHIEAYIDFPEEEIPESILNQISQNIKNITDEIQNHLQTFNQACILKDGFHISIIGQPNVGKSSILNALVKKDMAIVSDIAGTTRDIVQATCDMGGYSVIFSDTAGLREGIEHIEKEGIRRAVDNAQISDLIIAVEDFKNYPNLNQETLKTITGKENVLIVWNKNDNRQMCEDFSISVKNDFNIENLRKKIKNIIIEKTKSNAPLLTQIRYKKALENTLTNLNNSLLNKDIELKAEELRCATKTLGEITGIVKITDLFDIIFSQFCIGK